MTYDQEWRWARKRSYPELSPWLAERKGQACRVVARGKMNSVHVEFPDGRAAITSRYAVRRRPDFLGSGS